MTHLHMPPITGPIRIDPLAGHEPRWRPDHGEEPIYRQLIGELGPPGMLAGPATLVQAQIVTGRRARRGFIEVNHP